MSFGKVQSRGQVTIPQEIREAAGVRPGDRLLFAAESEGEFHVVVVPQRSSLDELLERYGGGPGVVESKRLWEQVAETIARDVTRGYDKGEKDRREIVNSTEGEGRGE